MDQGSPEWFAARVGVITASCFADVMAKPETAAYRNYVLQIATERLTGQPQGGDYTNAAMQWGSEQEIYAKAAYEAFTGDLITPCGLILHPDFPFAGASPDGFVGHRVLETKCPKSTTHVEYLRDKRLPAKYRAQVQGQLWVTGREVADFVSFDPRMPAHLQLLILYVERDQDYIDKLQAAVLAFNKEVEALLHELAPQ